MTTYYGKFSGNPKTEWLTDSAEADRDMKLLEDFWYEEPSGRKWEAPSGSVVNGASVPRALWAIVGSPYTGDYRKASIVHDVACDNPGIPRAEADDMFYYACLAGGCSKAQARQLYLGVRIGAAASGAKALETLSRGEIGYRLDRLDRAQEEALRVEFKAISEDLAKLDESADFDQLKKLVAGKLADPKRRSILHLGK